MTRNPYINIVFAAALLSLAVTLFVSYDIKIKLVESNLRKLHTAEVLETLEHVKLSLVETENSRRGYLLLTNTGNKLHYRFFADAIPELLNRLKKLTVDSQVQQKRLLKLVDLVTREHVNLGSSINTLEQEGYQPEKQAVMTDEGILLMSMIRAGIDEIANEEQNLLIVRRDAEQDRLRTLAYLFWGGLVAVGIMLSLMFFLARRERASREVTAAIVHEKSLDLETAYKDTTNLGNMTEFLQSCSSMAEAGEILSRYGSKMFKEDSGGIYVLNSSRKLVEALAVWGKCSVEPFVPDDCWSLRRGQSHVVRSPSDVICAHVKTDFKAYICVPMSAQHETLGVLHVALASVENSTELEKKLVMAATMAEQVGLALRNLQLREQLQELSIRDALTGLLNRRYIEESLLREISRALRYNLHLSVVMIDLDHFKTFNDTFGHKAGDTVLKEFGHLLQKHVRGSDIACRFGGEEFTLILPESTKEGALVMCNEIREDIKKLQITSGAESLGTVTISAGIAMFPEDGETSERLLAAADSALYRAKEMGRDRVEIYSAP